MLMVAVMALALGTVTTATAAGLTKGAVRRIAAKVVKKQAPSLSVASAANANTVGGLPASALQETRSVYTLAVSAGVAAVRSVIPLPGPGSYEISYSAFLNASTSTTSECWVERKNSSDIVLQFYADDGSAGVVAHTAHSAVDVVTVGATEVVQLGCAVDAGTFTTTSVEPIQIVVTPLAAVTSGTMTPARPSVGGKS